MKSRRGTILMIVIGAVICLVVIGAGTAAWFFASAYDSVASDDATASREFDDVRRRLGSEPPLIDMRTRNAVLARTPPDGTAPRDLQRVQILTWEPNEQKLSRITLPWWLIRLRDGSFEVSAEVGAGRGAGQLTVSTEDIERFGPALLIDHAEPDGSRVLAWTE